MKAFFIIFSLVFSLFGNASADDTVVKPENQSQNIDSRIAVNFKKINGLFKEIDTKIARIDQIRGGIDILIRNKNNLIVCGVLESLKMDIDEVSAEIPSNKSDNEAEEIESYRNSIENRIAAYNEQATYIKEHGIACLTN